MIEWVPQEKTIDRHVYLQILKTLGKRFVDQVNSSRLTLPSKEVSGQKFNSSANTLIVTGSGLTRLYALRDKKKASCVGRILNQSELLKRYRQRYERHSEGIDFRQCFDHWATRFGVTRKTRTEAYRRENC